jgi:hypothetical protein
MADIRLTFRWSNKDGQGRMSPSDSQDILDNVDPKVAADFLQDIISDASDLYEKLQQAKTMEHTQ